MTHVPVVFYTPLCTPKENEKAERAPRIGGYADEPLASGTGIESNRFLSTSAPARAHLPPPHTRPHTGGDR